MTQHERLHCPMCGYDLRGLGDVVDTRCPECGRLLSYRILSDPAMRYAGREAERRLFPFYWLPGIAGLVAGFANTAADLSQSMAFSLAARSITAFAVLTLIAAAALAIRCGWLSRQGASVASRVIAATIMMVVVALSNLAVAALPVMAIALITFVLG